jgi:hypothetical protein
LEIGKQKSGAAGQQTNFDLNAFHSLAPIRLPLIGSGVQSAKFQLGEFSSRPSPPMGEKGGTGGGGGRGTPDWKVR